MYNSTANMEWKLAEQHKQQELSQETAKLDLLNTGLSKEDKTMKENSIMI